jgi:hypothetical protein
VGRRTCVLVRVGAESVRTQSQRALLVLRGRRCGGDRSVVNTHSGLVARLVVSFGKVHGLSARAPSQRIASNEDLQVQGTRVVGAIHLKWRNGNSSLNHFFHPMLCCTGRMEGQECRGLFKSLHLEIQPSDLPDREEQDQPHNQADPRGR